MADDPGFPGLPGHQTVAQRNLACAIRLKARRRDLGLTQAEVVERVSRYGPALPVQALSAMENGRRLAVGRLSDLAAALDCTVTYLIGLTADPRSWQPDRPGRPAVPSPAVPPERAHHPVRKARSAQEARPDPARRSWILGPDVPGMPGSPGTRDRQAPAPTSSP